MKGKWILLLALGTLVSCATVPLASSESDADAKRFAPPEGRANLYVARSHTSNDENISLKVVVDGKAIGKIAPGTFYLVVVSPGRHGLAANSVQNSAKAFLDTEAGKNYFYEVTATSGVSGTQASLGMVLLEPMGKLMVQQAKRAQSAAE